MHKRFIVSTLGASLLAVGVVAVPTAAIAGPPGPPQGAIIVSNHTGTDAVQGCSTSTQPSIQAAVSAAAQDSTIYVCDGTYSETVSISQPVVLDGAQFGRDARSRSGPETLVTGGINYASGASTGTVNGFSLNDGGAGLEITAWNAGSGWTFTNNIIDVSNGGISFDTAGQTNPPESTIARNQFVQATPASENGGGDEGQAILIQNNTANNVDVVNNAFVNLSGPGGAINTSIFSTQCPATVDTADFSNDLTIADNSFVDNGNPLFAGGSDANFVVLFCTTNARLSHNTGTITDANDPNAESLLYLGGGDWSTTVDHNTLTGNGAGGAAGVSFNSDFYAAGTGVALTQNEITGFGYGINVRAGEFGDQGRGAGNAPSYFTIEHNKVTGSLTYGIAVHEGLFGVIAHNDVSGSGTDDCFDSTGPGGSGTAGTWNTWSGNHGATSSPTGLCKK